MEQKEVINRLASLYNGIEALKRFKGKAELLKDLRSSIYFLDDHPTEPELNARIYAEAKQRTATACSVGGVMADELIEGELING